MSKHLALLFCAAVVAALVLATSSPSSLVHGQAAPTTAAPSHFVLATVFSANTTHWVSQLKSSLESSLGIASDALTTAQIDNTTQVRVEFLGTSAAANAANCMQMPVAAMTSMGVLSFVELDPTPTTTTAVAATSTTSPIGGPAAPTTTAPTGYKRGEKEPGVIIGALVGFILVIGAVIYFWKKHSNRQASAAASTAGAGAEVALGRSDTERLIDGERPHQQPLQSASSFGTSLTISANDVTNVGAPILGNNVTRRAAAQSITSMPPEIVASAPSTSASPQAPSFTLPSTQAKSREAELDEL